MLGGFQFFNSGIAMILDWHGEGSGNGMLCVVGCWVPSGIHYTVVNV